MTDIYAAIKADARERFLVEAHESPSLLKYEERFQLGIHYSVRAASDRPVTDKDLLDVALRFPEILTMDPNAKRGGYTEETIGGAIMDAMVYLIDADLEKDLHPGQFAEYPGDEEALMEDDDYRERIAGSGPSAGPR